MGQKEYRQSLSEDIDDAFSKNVSSGSGWRGVFLIVIFMSLVVTAGYGFFRAKTDQKPSQAAMSATIKG